MRTNQYERLRYILSHGCKEGLVATPQKLGGSQRGTGPGGWNVAQWPLVQPESGALRAHTGKGH